MVTFLRKPPSSNVCWGTGYSRAKFAPELSPKRNLYRTKSLGNSPILAMFRTRTMQMPVAFSTQIRNAQSLSVSVSVSCWIK